MKQELRVLVFAKAPIPGQVKTRLIPALGAEGASVLHRQLVEHTLSRLGALCANTELWCAPDEKHAFFNEMQQRFGVELKSQQGSELGARMHHALNTALARAAKVVLIGTDAPMLDHQTVTAAFRALDQNPAVFTPTEDGGYALVGLNRPMPFLFEAMLWGHEDVMSITRERLTTAGVHWHELPRLWDLDRPEDLARFRARKVI